MAGYPAWDQDSAQSIISGLAHLEGATLPILHALQEEFGYVDRRRCLLIAEALNLSRAEVHGAISFYHDFKTAPPPAACDQALPRRGLPGARLRGAGRRISPMIMASRSMTTRLPAIVAVETVYCLGNCALGTSALVDGELIGRVDAAASPSSAAPDEGAHERRHKPIRIFVPIDAAALSVGAEGVAQAIAREAQARGSRSRLVRNGSRGMLWLEPLVEVETPRAASPTARSRPRMLPACSMPDFQSGGAHALRSATEELDWMKRQQRLTFARIGVTDPLSLAEYRAHGGLAGLEAALG
jgi:NADH:ubiquinone oxidoreductase subunit E